MESQISKEIRALVKNHRNLVQNYLNSLNLYMGQPRVLFRIEKNAGISQQELSELLEISKEATSVSIRRLEKSGFIKRDSCKRDRRIKLLYLSDKGEKVVKELRRNFDKINSQMFVDLNEEEEKELERIVKIMNKSLEKRLEDEKVI